MKHNRHEMSYGVTKNSIEYVCYIDKLEESFGTRIDYS